MRYGVIKTQKKDYDVQGGPIHWFRKGTLVRVLRDGDGVYGTEVESMYPVFCVPVVRGGSPSYSARKQIVNSEDIVLITPRVGPMLEALARVFRRTREFFGIA
jgi:hypothetical protein